MLDSSVNLDDIETSILIMTQKEDLNPSLLSSLDKAIFSNKFSIVLNGEQFYGYIYGFNDKDLGIYTTPLYNHLDIYEEFGRCLIIEWRVCQEVFAVYGVFPRDKKVTYAVDDKPNFTADRELFLNSFDVYKDNKALHDIGISCIGEVGGWFFRVACFYTDMTEELLDYLYKTNLVKLF